MSGGSKEVALSHIEGERRIIQAAGPTEEKENKTFTVGYRVGEKGESPVGPYFFAGHSSSTKYGKREKSLGGFGPRMGN